VKNAAVTDFIASTGFGVTAFQMFFFAAFAFAAALAFGLVARSYRTMDYYRKA
jgi:POT family proton-dependent oligopeptide transporter